MGFDFLNGKVVVALEKVGEGRFGKIYRAELSDSSVVAIKSTPPPHNTNDAKEGSLKEVSCSLMNEIEILKHITPHPNVMRYFTHFVSQIDSRTCIVSEYSNLGDLKCYMLRNEDTSKSIKFIMNVMIQLFEGLAHIHSLGIIHRDIKPSNLLVCDDDTAPGKLRIKICDFGIACASFIEGSANTVTGTIGYMVPELLNCQGYDNAVDIYAAGVVCYVLHTGKLPHERTACMKTALKFLCQR